MRANRGACYGRAPSWGTGYPFRRRDPCPAPAQQRTGLTGYGGLVYEEIYPGIELRYDGTDGELKSTYTVAPGASPNAIRWRYQGADDVTLAPDGSLQIISRVPIVEEGIRSTRVLTITEAAPIAWQGDGAGRVAVPVRFVLGANQTVRFALGAYDPTRPLVIDPTIAYSTRIGGNGHDGVSALVVDSTGAVYSVGRSTSSDYPTGANLINPGGFNTFVLTKMHPNGQSRLFSTYFSAGSTAGDATEQTWITDMAIDSDGVSYFVGATIARTTFPIVNARQPSHGGGYSDAFLMKITADGQNFVFSTYIGGPGDDGATGVTVDGAKTAYIAGYTNSTTGFPLANAYQSTFQGGAADAFVTTLTANGSLGVVSTYLGGSGSDRAMGVALTSTGQIVVAGQTDSANFPRTANAAYAQRTGETDGFVTMLPPLGGQLAYSSYAGIRAAPDPWYSYGIAATSADHIVMSYPTNHLPSDIDEQVGNSNVWIIRRDQLHVVSMRLNGSPNQFDVNLGALTGGSVAARSDGSIAVVGSIEEVPYRGDTYADAVVMVLDGTTGAILDGAVVGGSYGEVANDVATDVFGAVYMGGETASPDFQTSTVLPGSSGTTIESDGFVVKLTLPALTLSPSTRRIAYGYDALNRLTSATESGASTASYAYTYDRAGNRTGVTTNGVAQTFSFNSVNEITNPGWRYDATGNLTSTGTIDYTYDALGRMASQLVGGGRTDYTYNGDGVLVRDARGVTVNQYAQDLAAPLPQVLQINQDSTYYGLDRLATDLVPFARQWYLPDALGSTRQTVVGGGTLTAGRYEPWGTPIDNQIAPFGFAGELQGDGGLVYLRARWYTPQQGVFTAARWRPDESSPYIPLSNHAYAYALANPVNWTDPTGKCVPYVEEDCRPLWEPSATYTGWDDFRQYSADVVQGIGSPGAWIVDQFAGTNGWECIWAKPSIGKRLGVTFTGLAIAGGVYKYAVTPIAQRVAAWLAPAAATATGIITTRSREQAAHSLT